uniref:Uncharacterized protein n=1 Tax=Opuntia streptacantha TaxID=393608 RepID=A0A7C9CFY7_OPUST
MEENPSLSPVFRPLLPLQANRHSPASLAAFVGNSDVASRLHGTPPLPRHPLTQLFLPNSLLHAPLFFPLLYFNFSAQLPTLDHRHTAAPPTALPSPKTNPHTFTQILGKDLYLAVREMKSGSAGGKMENSRGGRWSVVLLCAVGLREFRN